VIIATHVLNLYLQVQPFLVFLQYFVMARTIFRIKNISVNEEARNLLESTGLHLYGTVSSMKQTARNSLAKSDRRSNVV
jgi:hypothetical protein